MTAHGQPGGCDLRCEKMRRPSSCRLWHWQLRRLTHFGKLFRSVPFHSLSVPIPLSDVRRYCKILIFNRYYRYYPILTGIGKIHILSDMIRFIQWTVWNNGKTHRDLAKKQMHSEQTDFLQEPQSWHSEEKLRSGWSVCTSNPTLELLDDFSAILCTGSIFAVHLGQHGDAFSNCQAIFAPRVQSEFLFPCASALAKHVDLLDQLLSASLSLDVF